MAIKRKDIRDIFGELEVTDKQIGDVMNLIHGEIDAIKDERDELQEKVDALEKNGGSDAKKWEDKYKAEHSDFEAYKSEQSQKEAKSAKINALKKLIEADESISEKGRSLIVSKTDVDGIELDDKGDIKDSKKLMDSIKEEWAVFVTETEESGAGLKGKDGAVTSGNPKGKKMTKEEIYAKDEKGRFKLTASERQKAITENPEAFQ